MNALTGDPLAYFLTWTTYGTWLPGDARGWVERASAGPHEPYQVPDAKRNRQARERMTCAPVLLAAEQRRVIEDTIGSVCKYRGWSLHAVNCRSNHVHVVLTAMGVGPERVTNQLKAWCSRSLNQLRGCEQDGKWWTRHGSTRYLNEEEAVAAAIDYVLNRQ